MATEKFTNSAFTTLDGDINNSTTSITVAAATGFPSAAQYRIVIDSEIMIVTAGAGTTSWTVTRGAESTSAVSHSDGATVAHTFTAGGLDQRTADSCQLVAYSSLPSAEKAGRLIFTTDGIHVFRDNGSTLEAYRNGRKVTIPPTSSNFTWDNQSGSTITDNAGTLYLQRACNDSNSISGMYKSVTAPYTLTVHFNPRFGDQNYSGYGLFWRQSSDGKIVSAQNYYLNGWIFGVRKWTNSTSFSSDYLSTIWLRPIEYFRLIDDNSNRKVHISSDGINWYEIHSIGRTDFLTANQIGFAIFPEKVGGGVTLTQGFSIDDWTQT